MGKLESFINAILETRKVWLLQAREGFFAMLEDGKGESYVPLWPSEDSAAQAAQGDWENYTVAEMGFSELKHWLHELADDEIYIAVAPESEGKITALDSSKFRKWIAQYADDSYKEVEDEDETDDEDHIVETNYGPDDKEFDYGDGWAQPWK